ncbi:MAG: hypothetical protein AAFZ65_02620, partial [Planctomycetota bacterium]
LAGVAGWIARARTPGTALPRRILWTLVLLACAQVLLVVFRGAGSARYLMPAAPAFAALTATGWLGSIERGGSSSGLARAALLALLVAWQASALIGGVLVEERLLLGN